MVLFFWFVFPVMATERVPPPPPPPTNSGVEKTASVAHPLQLAFLCDKAHMGRVVATGQFKPVRKLSPVEFTRKTKRTPGAALQIFHLVSLIGVIGVLSPSPAIPGT